MTEQEEEARKTPIFKEDRLIGYCSTVILSMSNEGLDSNYRYIIKDFEAAAEEVEG
ncbi:hypothetical protein I6N96_08990 [Enterococcus sp. BWM-S5]|uniref:Uncharacterized protein n=1 Tax=Enterococcus larvae TaxID=2794352 RepID=A0ABS4CKV2_9ENTE|nr:hypothetical protein [Enterococcus larvae]MBP1046419.1 hypothetical protein [Enterococcus larvae]